METEAIINITDRATEVLSYLIIAVFMYEVIKLFIPKENDKP